MAKNRIEEIRISHQVSFERTIVKFVRDGYSREYSDVGLESLMRLESLLNLFGGWQEGEFRVYLGCCLVRVNFTTPLDYRQGRKQLSGIIG